MKKVLWSIGILLLLLCAFGGYSMKASAQKLEEAAKKSAATTATVTKGTLAVTVVETGTVDADKVVDVKSRVSGRLAKLLVEEGDHVKQGQLIAIIDAKETSLLVQQNAAQLRGAQSSVERSSLEIKQRKLSAKAAFDQSVSQLKQLEQELKAQPVLTKSAITQAQTALVSAQQDKIRLVESVQPTQLAAADTAVREAKANIDNAEADYQRQLNLEAKGYVAGRTLENAKLTVELARARQQNAIDNRAKLDAQIKADIAKANEAVRMAQAQLTTARANSIQDEVKRQSYLSAVADVEKARAALMDPAVMEKQKEQSAATVAQLSSVLSDANRQLSETEIRAPIDGIVTKKELEVGELATGLSGFSSGTPILKIEDRRSMRIKLDVNEIDVAKMAVGMEAKVDVDAIPDHPFKGKVVKIAPASKVAATGASADSVVKYEVEIRLDAVDPSLRSGMSAKCSLDVIHHEGALLLPVDFVGKEGGKSFIDIAGAPKAPADRRFITVGSASGANVEILSGVKEGDVVQKPKFTGPKRQGMMQMGRDDG